MCNVSLPPRSASAPLLTYSSEKTAEIKKSKSTSPSKINQTPKTGLQNAIKNTNDKSMTDKTSTSSRTVNQRTSVKGKPILVAKTLTENLAPTAENFITQDNQNTITTQFKTQIKVLKSTVNYLGNTIIDNPNKTIQINSAIAAINDLVCRFNNNGVGGINKANSTNELTSSLQIVVEAHKEKYNATKTQLTKLEAEEEKGIPLSEEKKAAKKKFQDTISCLTTESKGDATLNLNNLVTLGENLEKLENFANQLSDVSNETNGQKLERMLNLIQQTALSAWVFNDINEALNPLELSVENSTTGDMAAMRTLNEGARATPMFQETNLEKLGIKKDDTKADNEPVNAFIAKYSDKKLGWRGRSGTENTQRRVLRRPIANQKEVNWKDNANISIISNSKDTATLTALKGGFVPSETANLKTVPDSMINELNELLSSNNDDVKTRAQKIAEQLKEKELVKYEKEKVIAKDSFAGIINAAGLPTYCSVSGTTGEIVSVFYHKLKDENGISQLKDTIDNLLLIANGQQPNPQDFNFSAFFAPVATFMEVGHFHTTAEVLGGFYSVAVAQHDAQKGSKTNLDTMQVGFENLLKYFNQHPNQFLGSN